MHSTSAFGITNVLNKKLDKLIQGREGKSLAMQVLSTTALEILKCGDDIVQMDDPDERREAWADFLDELGIPAELMM